MSTYTLAPREPGKEFLLAFIEPCQIIHFSIAHPPWTQGCRLVKWCVLLAAGQMLCWKGEAKVLNVCCRCLLVLLVELSAKIIMKCLDFLVEAKRSEQINILQNQYIQRKGTSTFFPMGSWKRVKLPVPGVSMVQEWLIHCPKIQLSCTIIRGILPHIDCRRTFPQFAAV